MWATLKQVTNEGYKDRIYGRAIEELKASTWTPEMIGTGSIRQHVVRAIEFPDNNLMKWDARQGPGSRVHHRIVDGTVDENAMEGALYRLFRDGKRDAATFNELIALLGKRYELIAYLFFVANPHRFLPIRTRTFDKFLKLLGVDLRTEGKCGWDNYLEYCSVMRQVMDDLAAIGFDHPSLLDAHSFAWMVARYDGDPLATAQCVFCEFDKVFTEAKPRVPSGEVSQGLVDDPLESAAKRQRAGERAEEAALVAERTRLTDGGRAELAKQVRPVANETSLGYDIESFDLDGSPRRIEVKNVTSSDRFFLSANEWKKCKEVAGYRFYLVDFKESPVRIYTVDPARLEERHLQPASYEVRY